MGLQIYSLSVKGPDTYVVLIRTMPLNTAYRRGTQSGSWRSTSCKVQL